MTKDVQIQVIYLKNLLRSLTYLNVERARFFEIILSKLIRMDVRDIRLVFFSFTRKISIELKGSRISARYSSC